MFRNVSVIFMLSKPKDYLRFTYSIVILLWFYHSRFVLLVVVLGGILRIYIPCYCCFQLSVGLLCLHSCMTVLGAVIWVLDCGASRWVFLLVNILCNNCIEKRNFGDGVVVNYVLVFFTEFIVVHTRNLIFQLKPTPHVASIHE